MIVRSTVDISTDEKSGRRNRAGLPARASNTNPARHTASKRTPSLVDRRIAHD
jgi:hypothetical protein